MEKNEEYDEISLKELIMALINNRVLILVLTLIVLILTGAYSYYASSNGKEAKLILSINHGLVHEGQNPDGTEFEPYEMASPYILKDVIKALELQGQISANDIRKNTSIQGIIPDRINKEEEFSIEKEGKSITYNPSQFIISIKADGKSGIDSVLAQRIANQLVESYITYFSDAYISTEPVVNKILTFTPDDYDYSDISKVFHEQLDSVVSYNKALDLIDPSYRSKNTGLSFNDIVQSVEIIDEIDLNRIDSVISSYKLTKDKDKLLIYYKYIIEELELEKRKLTSSKTISDEMLDKIENTSDALVLSMINNLEGQENSYFSSLILKTSKIGSESASLEQEIQFYKKELESISTDTYLSSVDKNSILKELQLNIDNTYKGLQSWIQLTNSTSSEFYKKLMNNAVQPLSPAEIYSSVNMKLNLAIGLVLGLMLGVFVAFFKEYWEKA